MVVVPGGGGGGGEGGQKREEDREIETDGQTEFKIGTQTEWRGDKLRQADSMRKTEMQTNRARERTRREKGGGDRQINRQTHTHTH